MSESNLTTNETIEQDDNVKTRFLLLDYLDYLLAISRDFRIGTKEGIYIPTFEMSTFEDKDEDQYEVRARSSKALMATYRSRLDTIPGRVNRVQRAKNLLRFDARDAASKAVTCQLGYADEIARRIMEIGKHKDYYIPLLQNVKSDLRAICNSMAVLKQRQANSGEYSGIKKMPKGLLQSDEAEISKYQGRISGLIQREGQLVETKTRELNTVIITCFCDKKKELPDNFDDEKADLLSVLPQGAWSLTEREIIKNDISYRDAQADALADESETCLREYSFLKNYAKLYDFCVTLLD